MELYRIQADDFLKGMLREGLEREIQPLQIKIKMVCKKANVNQLTINDLLEEIGSFTDQN